LCSCIHADGSPYYHRNASYAITAGLDSCNAALNCTLQDALLAVKADAIERDIPLRYFQWDDHESLDANFWPNSVTGMKPSNHIHTSSNHIHTFVLGTRFSMIPGVFKCSSESRTLESTEPLHTRADFVCTAGSAPYINPKGGYGQLNAGDIVFQDGVLFLGADPYVTDTSTRAFPLSLYIGHGDTSICEQSSQTGTVCPQIQNQSQSGYEWHGGVCVSPRKIRLTCIPTLIRNLATHLAHEKLSVNSRNFM
jgi:hypothetical protein